MKGKTRIILAAAGLIALAVVGYNAWSFCCGHCTLRTFVTPGPAGLALGLLTAAAVGTLVWLRLRRRPGGQTCSCGGGLAADWSYCPACGVPAGRPSATRMP